MLRGGLQKISTVFNRRDHYKVIFDETCQALRNQRVIVRDQDTDAFLSQIYGHVYRNRSWISNNESKRSDS